LVGFEARRVGNLLPDPGRRVASAESAFSQEQSTATKPYASIIDPSFGKTTIDENGFNTIERRGI